MMEEVNDEDDESFSDLAKKTLAAHAPVMMAEKDARIWEEAEFSSRTGDKIFELVEEFSRERFPSKHCTDANSKWVSSILVELSASDNNGTTKFVMPEQAKNKLYEIFHDATKFHTQELSNNSTKLTKDDIPRLRQRWMEISEDIMSGVPEQMPPWREVNHRIPLIYESLVYHYHLPRCPDAMKGQLLEKIARYTRAGWWQAIQTDQGAPMLCISKKTGLLRTAIDCRKRNDNTRKDVTPFPDQDQIRLDCARAKYRSKIDMSDAYEQIRTVAEDVWKTVFTTVYGTYVSHTMQIGDCNAPATFQHIMTMVFQEFIGCFVHVYLDDIFIYSKSIDDHECCNVYKKLYARSIGIDFVQIFPAGPREDTKMDFPRKRIKFV
jgi:hypothetical protein